MGPGRLLKHVQNARFCILYVFLRVFAMSGHYPNSFFTTFIKVTPWIPFRQVKKCLKRVDPNLTKVLPERVAGLVFGVVCVTITPSLRIPLGGLAPTSPGLLVQQTIGLQPINVLLPVTTQLVKPTVTREFPTN